MSFMFRTIALTWILLLGNNLIFSCPIFHLRDDKTDTAKVAQINVLPAKPLIEKDQYGQYLNFDIIVKNKSSLILDISAIQVSVYDASGNLALRKFINHNGRSSSIEIIGNTITKPGETIHIFNPLNTFDPGITIGSIKYEFFFNYEDTQAQKIHNQQRSPFDFDKSVVGIINPILYVAKTNLCLPLKGRLIIWDGHDFYAHHRRFPIGLPEQQTKGITANSNRYAYDFISIDAKGNMYKNSPFKKQNWYVFGKPVFAPGAGRIIAIQNNIPDNEFSGTTIVEPKISANADPNGMGNHVVIDHGNGEYSVLLHMERCSVKVKVGDMVKQGQQIGNIGFSGDAICPHLHYTVMNGSKELVSEGIPSYFSDYKLYRGKNYIKIKKGRIDSGDIVESQK
jgi:Peptidase family M23